MTRYYVAVCVPLASGGWRAFFPDAPDCDVDGSTLDRTVFHAADALATYAARPKGIAVEILRQPRDLATIRSDRKWQATHQIDWPVAVITMIPLGFET